MYVCIYRMFFSCSKHIYIYIYIKIMIHEREEINTQFSAVVQLEREKKK